MISLIFCENKFFFTSSVEYLRLLIVFWDYAYPSFLWKQYYFKTIPEAHVRRGVRIHMQVKTSVGFQGTQSTGEGQRPAAPVCQDLGVDMYLESVNGHSWPSWSLWCALIFCLLHGRLTAWLVRCHFLSTKIICWKESSYHNLCQCCHLLRKKILWVLFRTRSFSMESYDTLVYVRGSCCQMHRAL